MNVTLKHDNSCDSETDLFVSDQEDELIKLLDYSSQDDDVSPSLFYDNCEEVIGYIETKLKRPSKIIVKNDELNDRYNLAARNSVVDMDWRVIKYGENILLGEVKKLVDLVVELSEKCDNDRKKDVILREKANNELDHEMKRLSQFMEEIDSDGETEPQPIKEIATSTIRTMKTDVPTKKAKLEDKSPKVKLRNPLFKVKKVRPVSLVINLDVNGKKTPEIKSVEPLKVEPMEVEPKPQEETQKDEATSVIVKPEVLTKETSTKSEFWKMFVDDSDWWKEVAKRNLEKIEETRKDLARFIGKELVIGDYEKAMDEHAKEKETLQSFIEEVEHSKINNKNLEYDEKYENIVLKLIEFAKKDFNFKGFDPLIEQLKYLANLEIEPRRRKVINIEDIISVYSQIDITKYSYEELCLLEKYYKEIIRKYKKEYHLDKENLIPPNAERETKSASPTYNRNIILNVQSKENSRKNVNQFRHSVTFGDSPNRSQIERQRCESNVEIFDLTRTYPMEYYANNWWSIYEDVLRSRERQYGSIDNWWKFYEAVLSRGDAEDEELRRIRSVVEHRNRLRTRRPESRLAHQMRMLDEIKNDTFRETEDRSLRRDDSVRTLL